MFRLPFNMPIEKLLKTYPYTLKDKYKVYISSLVDRLAGLNWETDKILKTLKHFSLSKFEEKFITLAFELQESFKKGTN